MLTMAAVVAVMSWWIELMLVCKLDWYKNLLCRSSTANIVSSLGISWLLSQAFFAHGIIVLMAGAMSSLLSWLTYRAWALVRR